MNLLRFLYFNQCKDMLCIGWTRNFATKITFVVLEIIPNDFREIFRNWAANIKKKKFRET
jgi:hypothetical protein